MSIATVRGWFDSVVQGDSENEAAKRSGVPQGTLNRQLRTGGLAPENAVAIARAYKENPLRGLIAVGLITDVEARSFAAEISLTDVRDEDLVREVLQRVKAGRDDHPVLTTPLGNLPE